MAGKTQQKKTGGKASTPVAAAQKGGRKADGTFAKGNKPKVTENYGRPPEVLSFRHRMRVIAEKDPEVIDEVLAALLAIARDQGNPKCVEASDKLIKLFGNYDPAETKDVTPTAPDRPLKGLSLAEVREALAMKRGKKK